MQGYIDQANAKLERWETIKRFAILPSELSIEEGEVTPSQKVRRRAVEKRTPTAWTPCTTRTDGSVDPVTNAFARANEACARGRQTSGSRLRDSRDPHVPCPVRWGDLDAQGHVNNGFYVDYLQEARVHFLLTGPPEARDLLDSGVLVVSHRSSTCGRSAPSTR